MRYFEDFKEGEIIELGSRTVTQEEIIEFATEFDPQPFHIDPEKAKSSMFGSLIASGWHTGSMFMRMFAEKVLNDTISLGSPGLDEIRWLKPVRPGDTISVRYVVVETRPSNSRPNVGIVRSRSEVYNQHGELVCTISAANLFGRRPVEQN